MIQLLTATGPLRSREVVPLPGAELLPDPFADTHGKPKRHSGSKSLFTTAFNFGWEEEANNALT